MYPKYPPRDRRNGQTAPPLCARRSECRLAGMASVNVTHPIVSARKKAEKRDRYEEREKERDVSASTPSASTPSSTDSTLSRTRQQHLHPSACNLLYSYSRTTGFPYLFITRTSHLNHTRPQNAPHATHKFRVQVPCPTTKE